MLVQWIGKWLCTRVLGEENTSATPKSSPSSNYLRTASRVYVFVLVLAIMTTVPSITLALLPPEVFPASMTEIAELTFVSVFVPKPPVIGNRVVDLAEGVRNFLLWDVYIGSAASLLWGVVLYRNAFVEEDTVGKHSDQARTASTVSWKTLITKIGFWTMIAGPLGALAVLLWERDTIVKRKVKEGI
jgi:hypothetical protein